MALSDNQVGYWKLDGNSNDAVGSNNGTDTNITYSSGNGKINNGAGFNGISSKISFGTGTKSICPTSGDFTVAAWINLTTGLLTNAIYGRADQCQFTISTGNKVKLLIEPTDRSSTPTATGGTTLSTGTWYHVVGVVTAGTKIEVFVNGVSDGSNSSSIPSSYYDDNANEIYIGALDNNPDIAFFHGAIDEMAVWSRALSGAEITALYNSGAGTQYPYMTAYTLTAAVGAFTLTGVAAGLARGYTLTASAGSYVLTGISAAFHIALSLTAATGSYALTSVAASFSVARTMTASVGSYILTGLAVRFPTVYQALTKHTTNYTGITKHSTSYTGLTKHTTTYTPLDKSNPN